MSEGYESPPVSPADYAERNSPHGDGVGARAQGMFSGATRAFKDRAREVAEDQKAAGAARMDALGRVVHEAADDLGKEIPGAARYVHFAAENLESASSTLRNRSVDDFVTGVARFAKRQPAAAFAGAVLAGFTLSRFLKSSGH